MTDQAEGVHDAATRATKEERKENLEAIRDRLAVQNHPGAFIVAGFWFLNVGQYVAIK